MTEDAGEPGDEEEEVVVTVVTVLTGPGTGNARLWTVASPTSAGGRSASSARLPSLVRFLMLRVVN